MFNIYFENRFVSIRSDQEPAPENFLLFRLTGLENFQRLVLGRIVWKQIGFQNRY